MTSGTSVELKCGMEVRDTVSGFTGMVTSIAIYHGGDPRFQVTAHECSRDGDISEEWFDAGRLEVVETHTSGAAAIGLGVA